MSLPAAVAVADDHDAAAARTVEPPARELGAVGGGEGDVLPRDAEPRTARTRSRTADATPPRSRTPRPRHRRPRRRGPRPPRRRRRRASDAATKDMDLLTTGCGRRPYFRGPRRDSPGGVQTCRSATLDSGTCPGTSRPAPPPDDPAGRPRGDRRVEHLTDHGPDIAPLQAGSTRRAGTSSISDPDRREPPAPGARRSRSWRASGCWRSSSTTLTCATTGVRSRRTGCRLRRAAASSTTAASGATASRLPARTTGSR